MKRIFVSCAMFLVIACVCFSAERRLIGKEDINWGTDTFQDSLGTVFHKIDNTAALGIIIGDGINAITTGNKGFISVPYACTITGVTMLSDVIGAITIDIWKDTYANYPPTVSDTITASAKPALSSTQKYTDTTLTGWTKAIAAGDILVFNVDSASTVKQVTIILRVTR